MPVCRKIRSPSSVRQELRYRRQSTKEDQVSLSNERPFRTRLFLVDLLGRFDDFSEEPTRFDGAFGGRATSHAIGEHLLKGVDRFDDGVISGFDGLIVALARSDEALQHLRARNDQI